MVLSFGRIRVQILGNELLTRSIQPKRQDYLITVAEPLSQADAVIHLERLPDWNEGCFAEGWDNIVFQDKQTHVYSRNNKPVFALQYQQGQKDITVFASETGNSVRLGAQFGMLSVLNREVIGFHGVTLVCGKEIIILSAPSGTGKTTLGMLLERYCDAVVINGDFALLDPTEEGVIFEPTPFCGTSGRCLNHRLRIDRVVFLEQSKENEWRELDGREAMARFLGNAFVPVWDNRMQQAVKENIMKSLSLLCADLYRFAPTQEAAETFMKHIRT